MDSESCPSQFDDRAGIVDGPLGTNRPALRILGSVPLPHLGAVSVCPRRRAGHHSCGGACLRLSLAARVAVRPRSRWRDRGFRCSGRARRSQGAQASAQSPAGPGPDPFARPGWSASSAQPLRPRSAPKWSLVDRWGRRGTMTACDFARTAPLASGRWAVWLGRLNMAQLPVVPFSNRVRLRALQHCPTGRSAKPNRPRAVAEGDGAQRGGDPERDPGWLALAKAC